ncbi:MAG: helix-turn-helix domain-containing protein [Lentisphaeria bacterium]
MPSMLNNFSGTLTPQIRKKIKVKRMALGLTYYRLATFFGINWSTLRKWELGPTASCSLSKRLKVNNFLDGKYDKELETFSTIPITNGYHMIPNPVQMCMERISSTYTICKNNDELKQRLIRNINQTSCSILKKLVTTSIAKTSLERNTKNL